MKNLIAFVFTATVCLSFVGGGNIGKALPSATLKNLDGTSFDVSKIKKPAIISFWSTTCIPCIKELIAINGKYDDWKKEADFEVYAVSTDDARFASRVPVIVEKKGWKFPVLTDREKSIFKALHVTSNPYTIIIDKKGKIVYEHFSYQEGDEDELVTVIKGL
jgi:peroxiredoxin